MKKIYLSLILFFAFSCINIYAFSGGYGTSTSPYLIKTSADLAELASKVNGGTVDGYFGIYFSLGNDIDLSTYPNWTPIGSYDGGNSSAKAFQGIFRGNKYVIRNLTITTNIGDYDGDFSYAGLFGYINFATIENLRLENVSIKGGQKHIGGLVGQSVHSSILNCTVAGTIQQTANMFNEVGGLVGSATRSIIEKCYTDCYITGRAFKAGGIAGYIENDTAIRDSYSTGDLLAGSYSGGIVGAAMSYYNASVSNCYSTGRIIVQGYSICAGGIIGEVGGGSTIKNSVAINPIISADKLNRIVGDKWGSDPTTKNNYAISMVLMKNKTTIINGSGTDNTSFNGADATIASLQSKVFYSTASNWDASAWSISNHGESGTWNIRTDGKSFPYLKGQSAPVADLTATVSGTTTTFSFNLLNDASKVVLYNTYTGQSINMGAFNAGIRSYNLQDAHGVYSVIVYESGLQPSYSVKVATLFGGGSGIATDPYLIKTPAHLAKLANDINNSEFESIYVGAHFLLVNNLDLSGYSNWTSIGNEAQSYGYKIFCGFFNGNNKTIRNLTFAKNTYESFYDSGGLFGCIENADIRNLTLENVNINACSNYIGGLVAYAKKSTISNCSVSGKINGITTAIPGTGDNPYINRPYVGGIVGLANGKSISDCSFFGTISGDKAGGIAGNIYDVTLSNCYNEANIKNNDEYYDNYCGGMVGSGDQFQMKACYNIGQISGFDMVGGLIGYCDDQIIITDCYSSGDITLARIGGYANLGGLIGGTYNQANSISITNTYSSGDLLVEDGYHTAGGLVGYATGVTFSNSVAANSSITFNGGYYFLGRLCGDFYLRNTYRYNYAYNLMKISKQYSQPYSPVNIYDGIDKDLASLQSLSFYKSQENWENQGWDISYHESNSLWNIRTDNKSFPYMSGQSAPVAEVTANGTTLNFNLLNASKVSVYNDRTKVITDLGSFVSGNNSISYISQTSDVLRITVYETGKAASYAVKSIVNDNSSAIHNTITNSTWNAKVLNNELIITGLDLNLPVNLYTVNGVPLYSSVSTKNEMMILLPNAGVYILKVGNQSKKVTN